MSKVVCKQNIGDFKKGRHYIVDNIHSIFEKDDFISIINDNRELNRFRLNDSFEYIDGYIGYDEKNFYIFFDFVNDLRKKKLDKINGNS